jgi:hypothetical protein
MVARIAAHAAGLVMFGAGCAGPLSQGALARGAYEQSYLPASHNWKFRARYSGADRLFNAFDYGHAILYETQLAHPRDAAERLEGREFTFITTQLLKRPPRVTLEERAIGPTYATLLPELAAMFEWAHMLHRQIYDVWADTRLSHEQRDAQVGRLLRYYESRRDLALSDRPKSMDLMEGQSYSLSFRKADPKFNGLLWSYHWLQMALYDALLIDGSESDRRAAVDEAVARFWAMLNAAPDKMPAVMPMSAAIAPAFSARYPEAAIIFDNLHALHDVVADILASPDVPSYRKREFILAAAARFRDDTSSVVSRADWIAMSQAMGVERMGGVAVPPEKRERP